MTPQPGDGVAEIPLMTKPWLDIERTYHELVDHGLEVRGMLRLVEQIRAEDAFPRLERVIDQLRWSILEKTALA